MVGPLTCPLALWHRPGTPGAAPWPYRSAGVQANGIVRFFNMVVVCVCACVSCVCGGGHRSCVTTLAHQGAAAYVHANMFKPTCVHTSWACMPRHLSYSPVLPHHHVLSAHDLHRPQHLGMRRFPDHASDRDKLEHAKGAGALRELQKPAAVGRRIRRSLP